MSKAETLITDHLDTWTSAVKAKSSAGRGSGKKQEFYGIKKLRELILGLAVRGLLVPQDPNDEPASNLLQKVASERARFVEAGTISEEKGLEKIGPTEKEMAIPCGWDWCRLGSITLIVRGITFPASEKSKTPEIGRIACLRTSNVQDRIEWDDLLFIREGFAKRDDQIVLKDDIVMSMANSRELVGKVAIIESTPPHKTTFGGFLGVIRPILVVPHFVMILLRSPRVKEAMIASASQTTNIANVSLGKLKPMALPIPPLAEQHRIVAKVDELMALCDQLEQQQEDSVRTHASLVETLLGALTAASERGAFAEAWQRNAYHFDTLFTTESSIDQLKETILQLAVMGKLVEQDPEDEPASELLKKIAIERNHLIKDNKIRKPRPLSPVEEGNLAFSLPDGWIAARLGALFNAVYGKGLLTSELVEEGYPVFGANGIIGCYTKFLYKDSQLLVSCRGAYSGKPNISPPECFVTSNSIVLENPWKYLNQRFFFFALTAADKTSIVTGSAQPQVTAANLDPFPISVPPLAEQHRIVAKVDELMALCDRLKARLQSAQAIQLHLADTLVEAAIR